MKERLEKSELELLEMKQIKEENTKLRGDLERANSEIADIKARLQLGNQRLIEEQENVRILRRASNAVDMTTQITRLTKDLNRKKNSEKNLRSTISSLERECARKDEYIQDMREQIQQFEQNDRLATLFDE